MAMMAGKGITPATPILELNRPTAMALEKPLDILMSRDHLTGVYIRRQVGQVGQKPCCRVHNDVFAIGNKFITYGGTAVNVFNDVRSLDSVDFIWKVLKEDGDLHDF